MIQCSIFFLIKQEKRLREVISIRVLLARTQVSVQWYCKLCFILSNDGYIYHGQWDEQRVNRQGEGVILFKGGSRMEGHFEKDQANGEGTLFE